MGDVYDHRQEDIVKLIEYRGAVDHDTTIRVIILLGRALEGARRFYLAAREIAQIVVETTDPGPTDLGQDL